MVIHQPYKSTKQINFQDPCLALDDRKVNFTYIKEFLLKPSFLGQQREGEGNQSHGYQETSQCIRGVNTVINPCHRRSNTLLLALNPSRSQPEQTPGEDCGIWL